MNVVELQVLAINLDQKNCLDCLRQLTIKRRFPVKTIKGPVEITFTRFQLE